MRLFVAAILLLLSLSGADAQIAATWGGGGKNKVGAISNATLTVNLTGSGPTIPTNWVGLSFEVSDLVGGYYQGNTGSAASMIGLIQRLGTCGLIRIGGASSDSTPTPPALTQTIANNYNTFVTAIGACWKTIYGVDYKVNDPTTAATHAGYMATALGTANVVFQFGNEPELYTTPAAYITQWNTYYTSVSGAVSGVKVAAWDSGDFTDTITVINGLTPGLAGMSYLTQHFYSHYTTIGTLQHMYAILATQNSQAGFFNNSGYAASKSIPQRMSETNTVDNGGYNGISNAMGGASYLIMEQNILAQGGWAGVNIHGFYIQVPGFPPTAQYNPLVQLVDTNFGPGASYYSLFMFSKIAGQQVVPMSISGNANLSAIATKDSVTGFSDVLVTNIDVNKPAAVKLLQNTAWTNGTVLMMQDSDGQGCASANITVGGQPIGESGTWTGAATAITSSTPVIIPPCGAALIKVVN